MDRTEKKKGNKPDYEMNLKSSVEWDAHQKGMSCVTVEDGMMAPKMLEFLSLELQMLSYWKKGFYSGIRLMTLKCIITLNDSSGSNIIIRAFKSARGRHKSRFRGKCSEKKIKVRRILYYRF